MGFIIFFKGSPGSAFQQARYLLFQKSNTMWEGYCQVMVSNCIYMYFQFYSMSPNRAIFLFIYLLVKLIFDFTKEIFLLHLASSFSCKWNFWFTLCYSLLYNKCYHVFYITFYPPFTRMSNFWAHRNCKAILIFVEKERNDLNYQFLWQWEAYHS